MDLRFIEKTFLVKSDFKLNMILFFSFLIFDVFLNDFSCDFIANTANVVSNRP